MHGPKSRRGQCRGSGLNVSIRTMKLGFEETQVPYTSGSQKARAWTEQWVNAWVYCPNCGSPKINAFPNNSPVADFFCAACKDEYELKSQKSAFGSKVLDGSFQTKCERLAASNNPNLFLLNYDIKQLRVTNLLVVPKHFLHERSSRNGSRWRQMPGVPVGSDQISCSIKYRNRAKSSLCGQASLSRKLPYLPSGRELFS